MYAQQVQIVISFMILVEGAIVIGCGYLAAYLRWLASGYLWRADPAALVGIILFLMFVNSFMVGRVGLYSDKRPGSFLNVAWRLGIVVAVDFGALFVGLFSLKYDDIGRLFLLIYAVLLYASLLLARAVLDLYMDRRASRGFNRRQILVVGSDERARNMVEALRRQRSWGHHVVGCLRPGRDASNLCGVPDLGLVEDFDAVLHSHSVDEVVFVLPRTGDLGPMIDECRRLGLSYRVVPSMYDPHDLRPLSVERIQGIPTLSWNSVRINASGLLYKTIVDYLAGLIGFAVFALVYPFVAVAIRRESPGPVLFRQLRVGQNRRIFSMYKFRSMHVDAEERKQALMERNLMGGEAGQMFKMRDDPRVTRVGAFLRKTSLDELPQFINVLKGEMSLVGTRPPTVDEVERYEDWHFRRMSMKPGITGLWQISGRNKINSFDEVVKLDLAYIDNWRFFDDLKIIWKTIFVVLRRKGAL
ncbi:MAG: sugar transferase [Desulfovibrio sp.]|nr:sugar transferase [Desulfovibrio sp.]